MKHLKLFEDFVLESTKEHVVSEILVSLADDIQNLIGKHEQAYQKQFERPMSAYDKELTRLNIIFDMVKAIETYTLQTDSLVSVSSAISAKGNLEIFAQIQRGEQVYPFTTEVIYAGGYNIQRLHYRYITKTSIPSTNNRQVTAEYADKIKKLTKLEKINLEIQRFSDRIKENEERLQINRAKTDAQIFDEIADTEYRECWPSWKEIVKRGADKNYNYSEEEYNTKRLASNERQLEFWKSMNVKSVANQLIAFQKELIKLNKKIEQTL